MIGQKGIGGGSGVFGRTLRMIGQVENHKPGVRLDYLGVGVLWAVLGVKGRFNRGNSLISTDDNHGWNFHPHPDVVASPL